jgi:hypothetical protein
MPSLLAKIFFKENEMGEQQELFETGKRSWYKRLCQSLPPDVRQDVVSVLAQMRKKFLQAARQRKAAIRKESSDECRHGDGACQPRDPPPPLHRQFLLVS